MKKPNTNVSHSKSKNIKKRLYATISLLLVAILLVTGVTYAWMTLSTAPQLTGVTAVVGANGNLEIALTTTEHLAALRANDMYEDTPNTELANGDILHDNVLWGNLIDLNSSDYGLSTMSMRPAVLNVVDGCIADAPISIAKYGTDGRVEHVNSDPNNIDLSSLGLTGLYRTDKGGYYAGSVSMSVDDAQNGNYDKEALIQSVLDSREYGVRIAGPIDYSAYTNQDQTVANVNLMIDGYCFAVDMLFRTNAASANLLLQTEGVDRVDGEYEMDYTGSGSFINTDNPKLNAAIRVVFADTVTGQVYSLAQADAKGYLHIVARMDEGGNPVVVGSDDDTLIKPLTENQVSAVTAWVYIDGNVVNNSIASTLSDSSLKVNLQFATDALLNPAYGDNNTANPDDPDTPSEPDEPINPDEPDVPDEPDEPINPDEPNEPDEPDTPDDPDAVSGVDGNITWTYTPSNKTLLLSGSGSMQNHFLSTAPWYYLSDEIAKVIVDEGITTIGYSAFSDCTSLTSVTIPDSVTTIWTEAFYGCTSLTSVNIPDSVTSIGEGVFSDCTSLTSVTIPDSVTTIGDRAFYNCSSMTSVTIPDSVTTIGDRAFYECSSLTKVTIPNSVTAIGDYVLAYCHSLTSVTIPNSVTAIEDYALYHCTSLTSVTIPDSVTTIEMYSFYNCDSLTSVTIPDSVTTIGEYAFAFCDSLTSIDVDKNNPNYCDMDGVLFNKSKTTLIQCPGGKSGAYVIPDSVTTIGEYAFSSCSSLTSVTIPDSVTTIGEYAFAFCDSLTSVTIPDSVTTIGKSAFYKCTSLTSVTIPDSVTTIGKSAFSYCTSLTSVTIPDSVTTIGAEAFYGCTSLTSVTIPDSVTTIGMVSFYNCESLTDVYFEGSRTQWEAISISLGNADLTNATIHFAVAD